MAKGTTRCSVMVLGNTMDSQKTFMDNLTESPKIREVHSIKDSDVIIAFAPVVSRAGTDIQSAMKEIPKDKPVVLVVLHITSNPDAVVPDVRSYVDRDDVFVVDCLIHEDEGLLRSPRNDKAIRAVKNHLIREDHSKVDSNFHYWKVCAAVIVALICATNAEFILAVIVAVIGAVIDAVTSAIGAVTAVISAVGAVTGVVSSAVGAVIGAKIAVTLAVPCAVAGAIFGTVNAVTGAVISVVGAIIGAAIVVLKAVIGSFIAVNGALYVVIGILCVVKGAVIGAIIGAVIGAVIRARNAGKCAINGAVIGAVIIAALFAVVGVL